MRQPPPRRPSYWQISHVGVDAARPHPRSTGGHRDGRAAKAAGCSARWSGHHNRLNEPFPCGDGRGRTQQARSRAGADVHVGRRLQEPCLSAKIPGACVRTLPLEISRGPVRCKDLQPVVPRDALAGTASCSVENARFCRSLAEVAVLAGRLSRSDGGLSASDQLVHDQRALSRDPGQALWP